MFSLDQINAIHERLGSQASLPEYLHALRTIGVQRSDSFITDGHSEYFSKDEQKITSSPVYETLKIAQTCNKEEFLLQLKLHEQGQTDYFQMSKGLAASGIEKWTFDTVNMTIAYYDKAGNEMLVEKIR